MFKRKNSIGMTLIELLLALSLSLFLITLIFEIYLIAENNQRTQSDLISLQESEQILSQILQRHIHMAGYIGCAKLTDDFPFYNHLSENIGVNNIIEFFQLSEKNSDGIKIWRASTSSAMLTKPMRGYGTLYVTKSLHFFPGERIIISDCKTAELVRIKQVSSLSDGTQKIIMSTPLKKLFTPPAEVREFIRETYFLNETERFGPKQQPIYALFSKVNDEPKTEIVEGIESMQIELNQIENGSLKIKKISEIPDIVSPVGISFVFDTQLHKKWYTYVSLR